VSSSGQVLKNLVSHSVIYWFAIMLSKMIGFLLIPLYTRHLEPVDYGSLELLALTVDVISLVLGLQLVYAVAKFHGTAKTPEAKRRVISTAIIIVSVLATSFYVGLSFFADNVSLFVFGSIEFSYHFQVIFIASIFGVINQIPLLYLRMQDRSKLFVVITLAQVLLTVSLTVWMVVFLEMSVFGVVLANAIVSGLICVALLYSTMKSVGIKYDAVVAKKMFVYSVPLIPGVVGLFILHSSDRFFLNELATLEEVGLYAIGYKFGIIISALLTGPFALVWSAKMFEVYQHPDRDDVLNKVFLGFGIILVFCALWLSVFIEEVLQLMTTPQYYSAAAVVPVVAFAYVMHGLASVLATPLYAEKKTKALGYIHMSAAVVCLVLNYILIQLYGIMGAAVATLLSFLYIFIVTFVVSQRFSTVRWNWLDIVKLVLIAVVFARLEQLISFDLLLLNLLFKSALMVFFLLALVVAGVVKRDEARLLIALIQQRRLKKT